MSKILRPTFDDGGLVEIRMKVTPDIAHAIATDKEFLIGLNRQINTAVAALIYHCGGHIVMSVESLENVDPMKVRIARDEGKGEIRMWLEGSQPPEWLQESQAQVDEAEPAQPPAT